MNNFCACLVVFLSASAAFAGIPAMAHRASAQRDITPIWVSATAVVNEEGNLRTDLLPKWRLESLQQLRAIEAKRRPHPQAASANVGTALCHSFIGESDVDRPDPRRISSLDTALTHSRGIYLGHVASIAVGFYDGLPSSLMEVAVARSVREDGDYADQKRLYVTYPAAEFVAGGEAYCARPRFNRYVPRVGDRVIVFVLHPPADTGRQIAHAASRDLIFETRFGIEAAPDLQPDLDGVHTVRDAMELIERRVFDVTTNRSLPSMYK